MLVAMCLFTGFSTSKACTRIVYQSGENKTFTARTMDWQGNMKTNLWIFPRGIQRDGASGEGSVKWVSKYGSVISSAYDFATADGLNEKGLSVNLLWLSASKFPDRDAASKTMSLAIFPQYLLDTYATVSEAVTALNRREFIVLTGILPGDKNPAGIHLSLSDSSGDNAIIEFISGKMVIHHDKGYTVLTNDPVFEEHLASMSSFLAKDRKTVPGTYSSGDRFIRASYYTGRLPKVKDKHAALAAVFAMIRGISVPRNKSNNTPTIWRTVMDHDGLVYHFESGENPYNMFWVDLKEVDFSENAPVMMLKIADGKTYSGNATASFAASKPFAFFEV